MSSDVQGRDLRARAQQRKKAAFLRAYATTGNITAAADLAGTSRSNHYWWLAHDPDYAVAFEEAREEAADALELEARLRAIEGIEEPVFQGGTLVGSVRRYSDQLLITLLRASRPEKYAGRIRTIDVQRLAEEVAREHDLSVDELIAEVERILKRHEGDE